MTLSFGQLSNEEFPSEGGIVASIVTLSKVLQADGADTKDVKESGRIRFLMLYV